jgi:hypothetical protein
VLAIDPARPGEWVEEEPAPDGLLGPAIRVAGHTQARAPMFASAEANAQMAGQQERSLLLLPFANQGAIRGEYVVFVDYVQPKGGG